MAYGNRGVAYLLTKKYDLAIADFTKILEIDPKNISAYNGRIMVYAEKKDYDRAWEEVRRAKSLGIKIDPVVLEALTAASGRRK